MSTMLKGPLFATPMLSTPLLGGSGGAAAPAPVVMTPQLEAANRWGDLDSAWVEPARVVRAPAVWHGRGTAIARVTSEARGTVRTPAKISISARGAVVKSAKTQNIRKSALVAVGSARVLQEGFETALLLGLPEEFR